MIQFDLSKCVGCAACVQDCFPAALSMEDGKPALYAPERCIGCGHCIAICPTAAVCDPSLPMEEATAPKQPPVSPEALLETMTFRRSCRHFTAEPLTGDEIQMLISAGRACPTAKNLQGTSFIVVQQQVDTLRRAAIHALAQAGRDMLQNGCPADMVRRAENFVRWETQLAQDDGFDPLFFHAPALILLLSNQEGARDAAAAAAYMELLAHCMGLGCLYSGYFCAAASSPEIANQLALGPERRLIRCLVLGHPDIRFRRSAPRKPADIRYL